MHVPVSAELTPSAQRKDISPSVLVLLDTLEMPSLIATHCHLNQFAKQYVLTHASPTHVAHTVNAGTLMIKLSAHALRVISVHHQTAGQNV